MRRIRLQCLRRVFPANETDEFSRNDCPDRELLLNRRSGPLLQRLASDTD